MFQFVEYGPIHIDWSTYYIGEPDTRAVDTQAVDTKAVDARAVDTRAAISQKVNTMAAVSYHIINTYLYVHILIQCNVKSWTRGRHAL